MEINKKRKNDKTLTQIKEKYLKKRQTKKQILREKQKNIIFLYLLSLHLFYINLPK